MSEYSLVEEPVIQWLSGKPGFFPPDQGLGWTYRTEREMAAYDRPLSDPIVEALLTEAILRINPEVKTAAQAKPAIDALRLAMQHPDKLTANRMTLDLLREGVTLELMPGEPARTVEYIAFDTDRQHLNDFTATNQYKVQGSKKVREDTVLLVNGIPLVIAEYKSYITSRKDWREAVLQLHRYQRQAPLLLAPNLFCIAADEQEFRYGTILYHDASKEDIERHQDTWARWLSLYPDTKGYWNTPEADNPNDPLEAPVRGLLRLQPCQLLDFLAHFVVFETKKGKTTKKIARYQQFEAVNDMVDRAASLVGKPVAPQDRTGLIWHTQGSGKSLTMIFAGNKLRTHPALQNPTVLIVVDRRDLKTQLSDDFDSCDYPNVVKAMGVEDLKKKLCEGWRGTLVTTIQSFQRMSDLPPLQRDNIISLIDECHRSQKGAGTEGFAMTMRTKLPNAFRFGLTGTPIDRTMQNTHRDFGPVKEGVQERYLSYYGIRRSIKDGATLPVHYIRDMVPFKVAEEQLNTSFEQMCDEMEIEDEEAKEFIQRKSTQWKEIARHPDRIKIVIDKMLRHFLDHPDPNHFKAQLVAIDRTACVLYKEALDAELKKRGLPPEWSEVIISAAQNDDKSLLPFHYTKEKQDQQIEYFKLLPHQWEEYNRSIYGEDRSRWRPPLKILIVCDRLLTGFDAPIEQVMYLDKPLRDHNLLQAIARTNRPLPALGKKVGLVVDYFGVLQNLEKALNFDENIREEALIDWEKLKATVPEEMNRCLKPFTGVAQNESRNSLLAAIRLLTDAETAKGWEADFKSLERLWEAIAPDPCLYPYRFQYKWLCGIYIAHRRRQKNGTETPYGDLKAKTRELIRENTEFIYTVQSLPVFRIDGNTISQLEELPTAADKAAALEDALTQELTEETTSIQYKKLGQRLAELKRRKDDTDEATVERLEEYKNLTTEVVQIKTEPERLNLQSEEYALFEVLREFANSAQEEYLVRCARKMVAYLLDKQLLVPGWSQSRSASMKVGLSLLAESWDAAYADLGIDPNDPAPPVITQIVEALKKIDEQK